jgi:hypothetical protein
VTALAALENYLRRQRGVGGAFAVADAVARMVRFRATVRPNPAWRDAYREGFRAFERRLA